MTKLSTLEPFPPSHEEWNPSLKEWQGVVRESIMNSLGDYFRSSLQEVRTQHYKAIQFFEKSVELQLSGEVVDPSMKLLVSDARRLRRLSFGNAIYPLRRNTNFAFVAEYNVVIAFPFHYLQIQGKGQSLYEGIRNLEEHFHKRFQRLVAKSVFEMSNEERIEWNLFSQWVDVAKHKSLTPLEMRRIGTVHSLEPFQVQWLGEEEPSQIDLRKAPGLLASYGLGTEFEAMVEFHRGKQEVIRILCVGPVRGFSSNAPAAFEDNTLVEDTAEHGWNSF